MTDSTEKQPDDNTDGPNAPPRPDACDPEGAATVEAILFSTDTPTSAAKIAQVGELGGIRYVREAIDALNARYEQVGSAFRIETIAGGYQIQTRPEYHDIVSRLFKARNDSHLSQAAMETIAIVAYRQPLLRADVEAIRGVACGEVLRKLMERQLVKIVGRAEVLGRPMLYGTTRRFLEVFGLNDLADLPKFEELRDSYSAKPAKDTPADDEDTREIVEGENNEESIPSEQSGGTQMPADSAEIPSCESAEKAAQT